MADPGLKKGSFRLATNGEAMHSVHVNFSLIAVSFFLGEVR